jgi:ATP phosphoribosyltransferase regulatory subunit
VNELSKWKIHTPQGVQDILTGECYAKREIEAKLRNLFGQWCYDEVETPSIEFFDTFSAHIDLIPQENMFKFTDHEGRILVLRTENTIPVARLAATKYKDALYPLRFSYIGNMFKFNECGGGRQKEFTQAGVELLGVGTPEADAEVIALAINSVRETGLEKLQVDIGQVEFFKGIMQDTGFSEEDTDRIRELIEKKDYIGVEKLVDSRSMDKEKKNLLLGLTSLSGNPETIKKAEGLTENKLAREALAYIRNVLEILDDYGLSEYLSVDLGMVQSLNYYTGIIFRGFTHGLGFPILSGGRYDSLVGKYGRDCPATGFSLGINMAMTALERQKAGIEKPTADTIIMYGPSGRKTAFEICRKLREQGLKVETDTVCKDPGYVRGYAKSNGIGGLLNIVDENNIEIYNLKTGDIKKTSISGLIRAGEC